MARTVAAGKRLGLVGLARGEQAGRLASVDLVGREHAQGGQRMLVVVPGVEAGEVGHRSRDVSEVSGIDRLRFDRAEVGLDPRIGLKRQMQPYQTVQPQLSRLLTRFIR